MIRHTYLTGKAADIERYVRNLRSQMAVEHEAKLANGYYQDKGSPSEWFGKGAEMAGLSGEVETEELIRVLKAEGFDRQTKVFKDDEKEQRMAVDFTFSPSKSVSIAALALGDDRLIDAHDESLKVTLEFLQKYMATTRVNVNGVSQKKYLGNIIAALFRHEDARPIKGEADCQLHTHALIANLINRMALGGKQQWGTLELNFGHFNELRMLMDWIYKAEMARRTKGLGYGIYLTEDGFELEGITREQIEAFSRRSQAITDELAAAGIDRETASNHAREVAQKLSREAKLTLSDADHRTRWAARCQDMGISMDDLMEAGRKQRAEQEANQAVQEMTMPEDGTAPLSRAQEAFEVAKNHLGERETVFSPHRLAQEALKVGMGDIVYDDVLKILESSQDTLIETAQGVISLDAVETEGYVVGKMLAGKGNFERVMTARQAEKAIRLCEKHQGFPFSDGQRESLAMTLTGTDQVMGIFGAAGAGKTTAMESAVSLYREAGYETVGLTPSRKAQAALDEAGVDENMQITSFINKSVPGPSVPPRLYIMDEAGMASARLMREVLDRVRPQDRIVLVGDYRQLPAVEAGQPFKQLIENDMTYTPITETRRQKNLEQQQMVEAWAKGDAETAVGIAKGYMRVPQGLKKPEVADDPAKPKKKTRKKNATLEKERKQRILAGQGAERYLGLSPEERDNALVITTTNAVRDRVNDSIRAALVKSGEVEEGQAFSLLAKQRSIDTAAKRASPDVWEASINSGRTQMLVQIDGEWLEAVAVAKGRKSLITRDSKGNERKVSFAKLKTASVMQEKEKPLGIGDRVFFNANYKDQGVNNGDLGRIVGFDSETQKVSVQMLEKGQPGRTVEFDARKPLALDYGYGITTHGSQGMTVNQVVGVVESGNSDAANLMYVLMSRQKMNLEVITDNPDRLCEQSKRFMEKKTGQAIKSTLTDEQAQAVQGAFERGLNQVAQQQRQGMEMPDQPQRKAPTRTRSRDRGLSM